MKSKLDRQRQRMQVYADQCTTAAIDAMQRLSPQEFTALRRLIEKTIRDSKDQAERPQRLMGLLAKLALVCCHLQEYEREDLEKKANE